MLSSAGTESPSSAGRTVHAGNGRMFSPMFRGASFSGPIPVSREHDLAFGPVFCPVAVPDCGPESASATEDTGGSKYVFLLMGDYILRWPSFWNLRVPVLSQSPSAFCHGTNRFFLRNRTGRDGLSEWQPVRLCFFRTTVCA